MNCVIECFLNQMDIKDRAPCHKNTKLEFQLFLLQYTSHLNDIFPTCCKKHIAVPNHAMDCTHTQRRTHTHTDLLNFPPQCPSRLLFSERTNDTAIVRLSAYLCSYCVANQPINVPYVHPNGPISWHYPFTIFTPHPLLSLTRTQTHSA